MQKRLQYNIRAMNMRLNEEYMAKLADYCRDNGLIMWRVIDQLIGYYLADKNVPLDMDPAIIRTEHVSYKKMKNENTDQTENDETG